MRMPDVEDHIGLRNSKIYDMVKENQFPKPIKLGRVSVWLRSEVSEWMSERINATRA